MSRVEVVWEDGEVRHFRRCSGRAMMSRDWDRKVDSGDNDRRKVNWPTKPTLEWGHARRDPRITALATSYGRNTACYRDPLAYVAALDLTKRLIGQSVVSHPKIRGGRPVVAGTRILVSQVLRELADNERISDIADDFDLDVKTLESLLEALSLILNQAPRGGCDEKWSR
jgi:uncharacterized protein (DUF433 family)